MALSWLTAKGITAEKYDISLPLDSTLTASLITCYPGEEIYELCGHSALRIKGQGIDSVWNYGLFNFNEPNFVYRFVKGETDYMVAGYPFRWFLPEYQETGRRVVEQELNLSPQEVKSLREALQIVSLPANNKYRYNYIKDNCSTRIITRIDSASTERIIYPDNVNYGTFRNEMRAYHKNYPWYQFGIDIALGSGLDYKLNSREEMFIPVEFMKKAAGARFSDGRPLVKATHILNQGKDDATLPPTSMWGRPLVICWALGLIATGVCLYQFKTGKIARSFYFVWFMVLGLAGCVVTFLVFVSQHAATTPNALIFWLNPLQLFFSVGLCARRLKPLAIVMGCYNALGVTVLLIVWPFIRQSGNPAFFPLMGATAIMGATYAILALKSSYKINGHKHKKPFKKRK